MNNVRYNEIKHKYERGLIKKVGLRAVKAMSRFVSNEEKNRVQFIYLHHVFEDEKENFIKIIDNMKKIFTFISYTKAIKKILNNEIDRPYMSISFDDGLKNNIWAAKVLRKRDISACFFVCPNVVGKCDKNSKSKFFERINMPQCSVLSWEDIEKMKSMGHEIGGHTFSHKNLNRVGEKRARMEVERTFESLKERIHEPIHFAWPDGHFDDINERVVRTVFESGFASCASAVRGCHTSGCHGGLRELCIRRDHVVPGQPVKNPEVFLAMNTFLRCRQKNSWPEDWSVSAGDRESEYYR